MNYIPTHPFLHHCPWVLMVSNTPKTYTGPYICWGCSFCSNFFLGLNKLCVGLSLVRGTFQYGWPPISIITFLIATWVCQWCYNLDRHPIDEYLILVLSLSIYSVYQTQTLTNKVNVTLDASLKPFCYCGLLGVGNMGTWEGEMNIGMLMRAVLGWVGSKIYSNRFKHDLVLVWRFDRLIVAYGHHTNANRATRMTDESASLHYQVQNPPIVLMPLRALWISEIIQVYKPLYFIRVSIPCSCTGISPHHCMTILPEVIYWLQDHNYSHLHYCIYYIRSPCDHTLNSLYIVTLVLILVS
jgi:hypothetical protein